MYHEPNQYAVDALGRPFWILLAAGSVLLVLACTHATAVQERHSSPQALHGTTLSFDTPAAIVAIDDPSRDSTRHTLRDVLSVGGLVIGSRGDSLVIEPNLIVRRSESDLEKPRLITTRQAGLPQLVIVEVTSGVHVSDFGWRTKTSTSDQVERLIHLGLALFIVIALGGILFGPHR